MTVEVFAQLRCKWCAVLSPGHLYDEMASAKDFTLGHVIGAAKDAGWTTPYNRFALCKLCSLANRVNQQREGKREKTREVLRYLLDHDHDADLDKLPRTYDLPYQYVGLLKRLQEAKLIVVFNSQRIKASDRLKLLAKHLDLSPAHG